MVVSVHLFVATLLLRLSLSSFSRLGKKEGDARNLETAVCLTGSLRRLELASKIQNFLIPNLLQGHFIDLYVHLDPSEARQTMFHSNYNDTPFTNYKVAQLRMYVRKKMRRYMHRFKARYRWSVYNKFFIYRPIGASKMSKMYVGPSYNTDPNRATPESRFDANMRMFVNIRDCFRWVQEEEVKGNKIYDNIVRLRDDAYAFGPWVMDNIEISQAADELLDDWVDSRVDLLAWALHYPHPGCNSQFRRLQSDIQTCKTKAMRVNDLSYIGDMEVHG